MYSEHKKKEMLAQYKERDDKVFQFFGEVLEDIGSVFVRDDTGKELVSSRVQVITVFTFVDIVASYWFAYHNKTGTPTTRFTEWTREYCFTSRNKEFVGSAFERLDALRLFELRNSLVHFFGLASSKDSPHNFAISPNDDGKWKSVTEKLTKVLKKKGQELTVLESKKFYNLALEGSVLMLDEWKMIISEAQNDESKKMAHIEGIDRIFQRIEAEGALKVQMPEKESNGQ